MTEHHRVDALLFDELLICQSIYSTWELESAICFRILRGIDLTNITAPARPGSLPLELGLDGAAQVKENGLHWTPTKRLLARLPIPRSRPFDYRIILPVSIPESAPTG